MGRSMMDDTEYIKFVKKVTGINIGKNLTYNRLMAIHSHLCLEHVIEQPLIKETLSRMRIMRMRIDLDVQTRFNLEAAGRLT